MSIAAIPGELPALVSPIDRSEARVVVEQDGRPIAASVSIDDLRRLTALDRERTERFTALDDLRTAFADVSSSELEQEAERAIRAVREESQGSRRTISY